MILAEHVASVGFASLPRSVVEITKRSLLDALGVSLGASGQGEGCAAFVQLAMATGGGCPESTILGYGDKVAAPMAALANGAMAHALDFEDAYDGAPAHPNAPVVAALLAEAEAMGGVSGQRFLTALAVGCDLVCRLALAIEVDVTKAGWYPPPIFGAYGATAAVASLRGLTPRQVLDAFSLTLCQATCSAEIKYSPQSAIRAVRDAFAAQAGVLSVRLALGGVMGFDHPMGGKAGVLKLYGGEQVNLDVLTGQLGQTFLGEGVSFKVWPACRGTHAFIEMALALRADPEFDLEAVEEFRASGGPLQQMLMEPRDVKLAPESAINAKFSIPYVLALALVRGRVTLDDFDEGSLHDPAILRIANRVTFERAPGWGHQVGNAGKLDVRLRDGGLIQRQVNPALGHPDHPVDQDTLVAKFKDCAARAIRRLAGSEADRWVQAVLNLETADDVAAAIFGGGQNPR